MKQWGVLPALLLAGGFCVAQTSHTLTVAVDNITAAEGHLLIALYRLPVQQWQDEPLQLGEIAVAGQDISGPLSYRFQGLEPGRYALRLLHDENGNQQMDRNADGIPLESFAFSGEWPPEVIMPSPAQAAVEVPAVTSMTVTLIHPQAGPQ